MNEDPTHWVPLRASQALLILRMIRNRAEEFGGYVTEEEIEIAELLKQEFNRPQMAVPKGQPQKGHNAYER